MVIYTTLSVKGEVRWNDVAQILGSEVCVHNPRIIAQKLGTEVCAAKSSDGPNPYFAHYVYT